MVPDKRNITAAGGLFAAAAAAMALAACAPSGYGDAGADNPPAAPALANATGTPEAAPSAEEAPEDSANTAPVKFTEELKSASIPRMGTVVTDEKGWVLYRFDEDTAKPPKSNCYDKCAQIWPPAFSDGNPTIEGIDPDLVGTVAREDGQRQLTIGGWPVYRYIGDTKPGQWKGQGVDGTWFVVDPQGKKNLTCLPTSTPTAVQPPPDAAEESSTEESSSSGGGYSY